MAGNTEEITPQMNYSHGTVQVVNRSETQGHSFRHEDHPNMLTQC